MWKIGEGPRRYKRYLRLNGSVLSNHHREDEAPSWEISLLDAWAGQGRNEKEIDVQLPKRTVTYYVEDGGMWQRWLEKIERAKTRDVNMYYKPGDLLGEGAFAKVYYGTDKETSEKVAIKKVDKDSYDEDDFVYLSREVRLAQILAHDTIVETRDIFDSKRWLYIVMEFMAGGELFDIIADKGHLSEQEASHVIRDLIRCVSELHGKGVCHCDIKPENILCTGKTWPLTIKVCDFGLAKYSDIETGPTASKLTGTPGYVAPEVVKKQPFGKPVDMWACGVVLYIMLSGKMPFYGASDLECLSMTGRGAFSMPDREWRVISDDAKSLVRSLLQINPEKRLTAEAALQHRWLAVPEEFSADPINNDLSGLHSSRRRLRKAVHAAISVGRLRGIMEQANQLNLGGPNV